MRLVSSGNPHQVLHVAMTYMLSVVCMHASTAPWFPAHIITPSVITLGLIRDGVTFRIIDGLMIVHDLLPPDHHGVVVETSGGGEREKENWGEQRRASVILPNI